MKSLFVLVLSLMSAWVYAQYTPPCNSATHDEYIIELNLAGLCTALNIKLIESDTEIVRYSEVYSAGDWPGNYVKKIICLDEATNFGSLRYELAPVDPNAAGCCIDLFWPFGECDPLFVDRKPVSISGNCIEVGHGIGSYGEDKLVLYKYTSPVILNDCQVTVSLPDYCHQTADLGTNTTKSIVWEIQKQGDIIRPLSSANITPQLIVDMYGYVDPSESFIVYATDVTNFNGTLFEIPYAPSPAFRIESPAPQLSISTESMICDVPGRVQIQSSTIYNTIDFVSISILDELDIPVQIPNHGNNASVDFLPGELNGQYFELPPGSYSLRAMNVNTGYPDDDCSSYYDFAIVDESYNLTATPQVVHETCYGTPNDGSISLSNLNGQGPYTFQWTKDLDPSATFPNSSSISSLEGDFTYDVNFIDWFGCTGQLLNIQVLEPDPVVIASAYVSSNGGAGVSCHPSSYNGTTNDGAITVVASGGTAPLEYHLDGQINDHPYQDNPVFADLSTDTYTVYVRDSEGCVVSFNPPVQVSSPDLISFTSIDKTDIECTGTTLSEGSIIVNGATGGVGSYTYSLDGMTYQNEDEFRFLGEGKYTVWIRDDNSCVVQSSPITISSQALSVQIIEQEDLACADGEDGSATIAIQGGQAPYTIAWADGQSTLQAVNLSAGDHSVMVTDANGCEGNSSITINAPLPITLDTEYVSPTCVGDNDGSITVTAFGGNGGYVFTWLDGATGSSRIDLSAGIYSLTVTDSEGCDAQYNVELLEPPTVFLGDDKVICAGQPVLLQANLTGSYQWSATNGFSSTDVAVQVSEPGTYTLTVTDENGCVSEDDLVISISDALLTADFLMVSEAYEGDTIVLIDISWPAPDGVSWTFPAEASVITTDDAFVELRFDQAGTYMVELNAQLGGCEDQYASEITVRSGSRPDTGGRIASKGIIQQVTLSPNPTTGHAILSLLLREPMPVDIRLISVDGGQILLRDHGDGQKQYEWEMDIQSRSSGVYYLAVRVGDEVKMLRLVKV